MPFKLSGISRPPLAFFMGRTQDAPAKPYREPVMTAVRRGIEPLIPALRRFARALSRDAETADDLVQDTLVRALRAEHLFHGGDLRTWLFTILLNLDRNRRRGLSRRPVLAAIEEVDPPGNPGSDGTGRDIERGLALLPAEQRE